MTVCPACGHAFHPKACLPVPAEPPVGTWMRDRFGGVTRRHASGGWAPPGCEPFGRWDAMWEARGPYVECGPWGAELTEEATK